MDPLRVTRVLKEMENMNLSQMLITDPMSIYYLTGKYIEPFERFYALYLNADGNHVFFLNNLFTVPEDFGIEKVWFSDTDDSTALVAAKLDSNLPLGVDKDMKARHLLPLMERKAASGFVNASICVDKTRGIKDEKEQILMAEASRINDLAMAEFKQLIREGVTEKEVAEQTLDIYKKLGASGFSFTPIVSFGANAADPHHEPDDTVLKEGDCVLFDVGCIKDGYCSDMTRTFFYKKVNEEQKKVYELVKSANESAIAKIKAGVPLCELDQTAREIISEAGYGPNFNHRLGHFIGLSEHEFGDVSSANKELAKEGMIFSIEPGIYLEGNFGVRIEDLVLVTEDGVKVLNSYSKELEIIE
jgi:Xaa-Pro dipeptidase